jgi:excisionase family DNA binding protein
VKFLTPAQVAEELACSLDHVYDLIRAGVLRAKDISRPGSKRRTYRIPASAIESLPEAGIPKGTCRERERPRGQVRGSGLTEFYRVVDEIKREVRERSKAHGPRQSRFSGRRGKTISPELIKPSLRPSEAQADTITIPEKERWAE